MSGTKTHRDESALRRPFDLSELTIEPRSGTISGPAGRVQLDPKVMAVLILLAERAGEVVAREELLAKVWPGTVVGDDALSRCIYQIRRHLRQAGGSEQFGGLLETLPKRGYRLNCKPVAAISESPEAARRLRPEVRVGPTRSVSSKVFASAMLVIGIAVIGGAYWLSDRPLESLDSGGELLGSDRDVAFLRTNLAQIANALGVTVMDKDLARLREIPPSSERALLHFIRGNEYFRRSNNRPVDLRLAREQFERATDEDPEFALAYARLSIAEMGYYWFDIDRTPERLAKAEAAIDKAFELVPDLPEAHVAIGNYLSRGFGRYNEALQHFDIAAEAISNDSDLYLLRASVYRHLGRLSDSIRDLDQAIAIDGKNVRYLRQQHQNYLFMRDYDRADELLDEILDFNPDDGSTYVDRVLLAIYREGDTALAHQYDHAPPTEGYLEEPLYTYMRWLAAIFDRDYARAIDVLDREPRNLVRTDNSFSPKALFYARTYRLRGNAEEARAQFESAAKEIEDRWAGIEEEDRNPAALRDLAEVRAGLGRIGPALESLQRERSTPSAILGADLRLHGVREILLPLGQEDQALEELDYYLRESGAWSIEALSKDPRLERIRSHPGFRILEERYASARRISPGVGTRLRN
jgi:DNA-binding winged helix-turn-helix (wHTH) protein/tetratricopeptide (TPR) repeat protein